MTLVLLAVAAIATVIGYGMRNNGNNEFTPTGTFPLQFN